MRTIQSELLEVLQAETLAQYERMQTLYPEVLLPFGSAEQRAWNRWRRKSDWSDLAGMVGDVSMKLPFRSRALLLLLSPVWVKGIPWTVGPDAELTRVFTGAEDYLGSRGKRILSSADEALIELTLSFMEGFQNLPTSLIERALVNYSVLRRHILSILPEDSPLALKAFEGYRFFDYALCGERHHCLDHILTPLELLLVRGSIPEVWKLRADEMVWAEIVRQGKSQQGVELWKRYLGIINKGLSRQPRSDEELPETMYPLRVLKQQLEHIWSVAPEELLDRESNASRFLDVFHKGKSDLRDFGQQLFQRMICSEEAASFWFSEVESMSSSLHGLAGSVVSDAIRKLGGPRRKYAQQLLGWFEVWARKQQEASRNEREKQRKKTAQEQKLLDEMRD